MRTDNRAKHTANTMMRAREETRHLVPMWDVREHFDKLGRRGIADVFVIRMCDGYRIRFKVRKGSMSVSAGCFTSSIPLEEFAAEMQHAAAELHESTMRRSA